MKSQKIAKNRARQKTKVPIFKRKEGQLYAYSKLQSANLNLFSFEEETKTASQSHEKALTPKPSCSPTT